MSEQVNWKDAKYPPGTYVFIRAQHEHPDSRRAVYKTRSAVAYDGVVEIWRCERSKWGELFDLACRYQSLGNLYDNAIKALMGDGTYSYAELYFDIAERYVVKEDDIDPIPAYNRGKEE